MNTFILVSICSTIIVGSHGLPQSIIDNEVITQDDSMKENIAYNMQVLKLLTDGQEMAAAVVKSIDQDCMLRKYKETKHESELSRDMLDLQKLERNRPVDPYLIFGIIGVTCSNKLDTLLGFAFDNLLSYNSFLEAFKDDEPIKKYYDNLTCYNNYAVKKNLIDPSEYDNFNFKLVNQTEAECEKVVTDIVQNFMEFGEMVMVKQRKCFVGGIISGIEKFLLKYGLLVPLTLTADQKKYKRVDFIADVHEVLKKLLECNPNLEGQEDDEIPT